MGFYIRKGFNFGPLRLNLSRSGLGASFGVKGARIGIGPRGRYIHMGRGGLYYRQSLNPHPASPTSQIIPTAPLISMHAITSDSASTIADSSATELLAELNRVHNRADLFPIALLLGGFAVMFSFVTAPLWISIPVFALCLALMLVARHTDVLDGTAVLHYDLDTDSQKEFTDLRQRFNRLRTCDAVWHVEAEGRTGDWKRNSGVSTIAQRSRVHPSESLPPKVQCNIVVPSLRAGSKHLYFFPDRVLIYDSTGVGAVSYGHLSAQAGEVRFIDSDPVPSDAQQVGTTWQFVNRNGGPDRRFANNRELPVMLYGELRLKSDSGLNELFQTSLGQAATQVASSLKNMSV